ncbi:hypothetical protein ASZ90_008593 [hydrocarbon metagenome]|uniref:Integral membrane protein n=1 Tax=hydrocarbon metagenome TaxID=938273 RepID=A0A0W8FL76_9ZZZZ
MDLNDIIKIICFYILVASGETLNGIGRTLYLNRRVGAVKAKRISIIPAIILCLIICYFYVPIIGITTDQGLLLLGISLSAFMLLFDVFLGKFVMKAKLSVILDDLNIFKGNLLAVGLILMTFCPLLAIKLRNIL